MLNRTLIAAAGSALLMESAQAKGSWAMTFTAVEDILLWWAGYVYGFSGYTPRLTLTEHCIDSVIDFYSGFHDTTSNCFDFNVVRCMTNLKKEYDTWQYGIAQNCADMH